MSVRGRIPVILSGVVAVTTIAIASACSQSGSLPAGPSALGGSTEAGVSSPLSATVRFGNDSVGSKFPTPSGHDNSGHARDNLIPRTAVIDQGGTVTFVMGGPVHQVAIYDDGTTPEQVSRQATILKPKCPPAPYITDQTLVAGTKIKAAHLSELRDALKGWCTTFDCR